MTPTTVPDGWRKLEAGPLRKVRVNGAWVNSESDKPYRVDDGVAVTAFSDITVVGPAWLVCEDRGKRLRRAWMETNGELYVRD